MKKEATKERPNLAASVCICTYNGGRRLREVVEALSVQTQPGDTWELIIVDNASTDNTGAVASGLIEGFLPKRGRVVHESRSGLSFARDRASHEAGGDIICFLDDDNVPASSFVEAAVRSFVQNPKMGAVGGKVLPVWESTPSPLALAVQDFALAIVDRGDKPMKYEAGVGPVGAGLCIKTELMRNILQYAGGLRTVVGRKTSGFGGGEDLAISMLVWELGYECWYDPALVIQHLLPTRRMEKDYLLRLYNGIGRGQAAVRRLHDWKARSPLAVLIAAKDFARWLKRSWNPAAGIPYNGNDGLLRDLNDLEKRLLLGRALATITLS